MTAAATATAVSAPFRTDAYERWSIWEHSATVHELYAGRCRREQPEMTCAAQAAELLAPFVEAGDTLVDAGCGSGYLYHSLHDRAIAVEYWGIDASPTLIGIGRTWMPDHGLPAERLVNARIEDVDGSVDHVVCLNVLSNIDNYHRPLERLAAMATKTLILRESITDVSTCLYVTDHFLDDEVQLDVHVNHYGRAELAAFLGRRGFEVTFVTDRRTGGRPEAVIGHDHYWTFVVAVRKHA